MARFLIMLGLFVLLVAGLLWPYLGRIGLGRLPGDIVIERENVTFYFPVRTVLLLSRLFSLVFWVVNRCGGAGHRTGCRDPRAAFPGEVVWERFDDAPFRASSMPCKCAAAFSMSKCLYWPARLSAA